MKTKILAIYKNSDHIQSVTFQKDNEAIGWIATNFDRDKTLPFSIHETLENMKKELIEQELTWEWKDTSWLF